MFPEQKLTMVEQINYEPKPETTSIVTNSPFIVAKYDMSVVSVYNPDNDSLNPVEFQTYGADFGVILKSLSDVRSLIPSSVVEEIREKLKESDAIAHKFIDKKLGSSAERAYLLRKLAHNE